MLTTFSSVRNSSDVEKAVPKARSSRNGETVRRNSGTSVCRAQTRGGGSERVPLAVGRRKATTCSGAFPQVSAIPQPQQRSGQFTPLGFRQSGTPKTGRTISSFTRSTPVAGNRARLQPGKVLSKRSNGSGPCLKTLCRRLSRFNRKLLVPSLRRGIRRNRRSRTHPML